MKTNQNTLRITLLQTAPIWENKEANYKLTAEWIAGESEKGLLEIVLLPAPWEIQNPFPTQTSAGKSCTLL